jgi:peroxiredoxin
LRAYQGILDELEAADASLVAISPQKPDNSLSTKEKNELRFEVLSDPENGVARAYGLVFRFSDELVATYEGMGRDRTEINDTAEWELPVPGTFVVDRGGVIRLAHVDADYTRRLEPDELLAAVRSL